MKNPDRKKAAATKDQQAADLCTRCGRMQESWSQDEGKGFEVESQMYCCEACSQGVGCVCDAAGQHSEPIARIEEGN